MKLFSYYTVMSALVAGLILLLVTRLLKAFFKKKKTPKVNLKEVCLLILPATSILVVYAMLRFHLEAPYINISEVWVCTLSALLVAVNLVVFRVIDKQQDSAALKVQLCNAKQVQAAQEQYYRTQAQYMREQRARSDNYKKQLALLLNLTATDDSALRHYLAQLIDEAPVNLSDKQADS